MEKNLTGFAGAKKNPNGTFRLTWFFEQCFNHIVELSIRGRLQYSQSICCDN